ncbi:MAG: hypothetical protein ABIQ39_06540, partial [Ilumatobacteraceae bacterium]
MKSASKTSGVRTAADNNAPQSGQVDAALVVDITSSTGVESEASGLVRRPVRRAPAAVEAQSAPVVRGVSKDGVAYTKDFDIKFLTTQKALLLSEKQALLGQAIRLEDEANSLIEESEMGDVQFDDEGGEGDTTVVERERDLVLSAQARQMITEIDAALIRLGEGTYGYSIESGRPI